MKNKNFLFIIKNTADAIDFSFARFYNRYMKQNHNKKRPIDVDAYFTDLSTVRYSGIFVTKFGLMKDNPKQYYSYMQDERHDYCLQYVARGEGFFFTNNTLYTVKKGDVFLLPRSTEHYYKANAANPYDYYWIHFNGSGIEEYLSFIGLTDENPIIRNVFDEEIVRTFERLMNVSKDKTNLNQLLILSLGYEILYRIASKISANETSGGSSYDQLCNNVTNYIIENFKQPITLDDIAKKCALDKRYLIRVYKKKTGFSPIHFLINYRLEYACILLKQDFPINEVAYACGFNDVPNFNVRFKKVMGMTPGEFKRQQSLK